jgi:hypothetical protein
VNKKNVVNVWLDDNEHALFMEAMLEYENTIGKRVSVGKFMRDVFIPMLNEDNEPNIYQEILKHRPNIVSQPPSQSDSNQKNKEDPIQSPEVVPKNVSNKLSDTFKFTL